jgi:hypothetical protein
MLARTHGSAKSSADERFYVLLKSLADANDPESAQVVSRQLSELLAKELPEYAGDFLKELKKYTQEPRWKREQAAEIAEALIFRLYEPKNPISPGLKSTSGRLSRNIRSRQSLLVAVVGGISQLLLLLVLALFWPYGQLFKAMESLLRLMEVSKTSADFRASSEIERFPYLFEAGVYLILSVPVILLCLPFFCVIAFMEFVGKIGS